MTHPVSIVPAAVATTLVAVAVWAAAARAPHSVSAATPTVSPREGGPDDVATTLGRAWAAYTVGDFATAVTAYRAAAEAEPRAVTPLLGLMYCEAARRDAAAALAAAHAVLERDPANPQAHRHVAIAAYDRSDFTAAETACRDGLASYPEDIEAGALLGWCLLRQSRAAEARVRFQAVLAVVPHHASAAAGLAAADAATSDAGRKAPP